MKTPEQYLREKGYKLRTAPGQWQTACPFCGDQARHGGHLYVNREHGAWMCQRCERQGSFFSLQTELGDTPEPFEKELADKRQLYADAIPIFQDTLIEKPEVLSYLKNRGLKAATIGKYQLGFAPKDLIDRLHRKGYTNADIRAAGLYTTNSEGKEYPLFWDRIMIPYLQRGYAVTLRGKQFPKGNVLQARDTSIALFGPDNLLGHKEVYICEGEMDAMLLDQMGYAACAIPGALSWQAHWQPWFEDARRIFICLDADEAGIQGAHKIKAALGERARIVEFPVPNGQTTTDVGEYFLRDNNTVKDFDKLVDGVRGRRVFTFSDSYTDDSTLRAKDGVQLGWKDLDFAITGMLPGQVMTVLAKTGAGKTALISQIVFNLSMWQDFDKAEEGPGVPTLVLSLEQTKSEFATRLHRIGTLHNPWATTEEQSKWYGTMRINDENQVPPAEVRTLIDEYIEEVGVPPRMVIVDYLGYWSRAFKGTSKYEQVTEAIMELKRIAKEYEVTIIAPHQVSRTGKRGERLELDHARDSGAVEETSDFVLGLWRPYDNADEEKQLSWRQEADVRLELLKSRHGNVGKEVRLLWAPYSLAMVSTSMSSTMESRISKEWRAQAHMKTYEEVVPILQGKAWI